MRQPKGMFHVWTKRIGNNPKVKVLLLHGGPAAGHESGIEYYSYDQLGSSYSDEPRRRTSSTIRAEADDVDARHRRALRHSAALYQAAMPRCVQATLSRWTPRI